ncbi:MAG: 5-formyltetrahydrofolate cyclo-ligase [Phycisphaerales bacterium]|jgi:5-formyltetrahydrofolate cyclo-ligase|nr:5-formyltetrahydrofolate cyclo-ligase [Phycisphaerales bacterium]MDB5357726.1 5-formyltetrahydrofolate cyclo-ligase [Phycisphaerales bacterium]
MSDMNSKADVRRHLKQLLAGMNEVDVHRKSIAACGHLAGSPEFAAARVVMLYLSTPHELDTAPLALKCWQAGKTVVVPKVSWDQRRMLPVEITSLQTGITTTGPNIREPIAGKPIPLDLLDLVVVPGLGFSSNGYRIGRGMGFYDRFLAQPDFIGLSCGLAFHEQIIENVPVLDHDVPLGMLVTDRGITRFASEFIQAE